VASLSQGRTAAAQCGLFTYKSVPVIFEPPCTFAFGVDVLILKFSQIFCNPQLYFRNSYSFCITALLLLLVVVVAMVMMIIIITIIMGRYFA